MSEQRDEQAWVTVTWRDRAVPLSPSAALGLGPVATALGERLERLSDGELGQLEAAAGSEALLVLGAAEALPWVDGVIYLGRDPRAPSLLLPTAVEPAMHPVLIESAIARQFAGPGLVAVVDSPPRLVRVEAPRALDRRRLAALRGEVRR